MYRRILVPLDGSNRAEAILPHVENLAQRYGAQVVLLQVVEVPRLILTESMDLATYQDVLAQRAEDGRAYLATIQQDLARKGIQARTIIAHAPVVNAIIDTAQEEAVDLIALASHGRTGLSRVFYGSVAAGVLHRIDRPLLLIRSLDDR
jgi:nucleotide-binding universal stress UspA family protein